MSEHNRSLTPKDFALALAARGIDRSARWVRRQCALRRIKALPGFGVYYIPASELERVATRGIGKEAAA